MFEGATTTLLAPAYTRNGQTTYLVDLATTLPDSVQVGRGRIPLFFRQRVLPGQKEVVQAGNIQIRFNAESLFDTLYLSTRTLLDNTLEINQYTIPINDHIDVRYTPLRPVAVDTMRTKMYALSGGRQRFLGGNWANGRIEFRTRELGRFGLLTDVTPPDIRNVSATPGGITARISDDLSGIDQFRVFVGGVWTLMQYDYKRALIWSDKLDATTLFEPGTEVRLQVRDRTGNVAELTTAIATPPAPRPARRKRR